MKRHGGPLSTHYKVKEDNLKRLQIILFQPCNILEKAKLKSLYKKKKISDCQELRVLGEVEQAEHRGFFRAVKIWYGTIMVFHYTSVKTHRTNTKNDP